MEGWMKELGVVKHLGDLDVTEDMIDGTADGTIIIKGGYKALNRDEVLQILKDSL